MNKNHLFSKQKAKIRDKMNAASISSPDQKKMIPPVTNQNPKIKYPKTGKGAG